MKIRSFFITHSITGLATGFAFFIFFCTAITPSAYALRKAGSAAVPPAPVSASKPFLVVIDPGHGGSDHGTFVHPKIAPSETILEKDLTLLLSLEVAKQLELKKIKTTLTRSDDTFLELPDRTALANRLKADLFISIHMNSSPPPTDKKSQVSRSWGGIETYILNNSTNESSIRLADLENKVLRGSIAEQQKQTSVALILKDLILDGNLQSSQHAACLIQDSLVRATHPHTANGAKKDRGVKQGLFYVLLGADMPSVLIEAGFLDNAYDRNLIVQPSSRTRLSRAIVQAIERFRNERATPLARKTISRCKIN